MVLMAIEVEMEIEAKVKMKVERALIFALLEDLAH